MVIDFPKNHPMTFETLKAGLMVLTGVQPRMVLKRPKYGAWVYSIGGYEIRLHGYDDHSSVSISERIKDDYADAIYSWKGCDTAIWYAFQRARHAT